MEALAPANLDGHRRPWQDLPSELLGIVLQRLLSHADRVRLHAVCRPWRAGARLQPPLPLPPLLPWIALRDGSFLSLPDGEVHRRVLVPDDNVAHRVSTGSMLFLVHKEEGCSLMNPLARETTTPQHINLHCLRTEPGALLNVDNIRKVVVMSDHVVAVRTGNRRDFRNVTISIRRPQSKTVECRWRPPTLINGGELDERLLVVDIALFQHKLYVLTATDAREHPLQLHLYAMDIVGDKHVKVQRIVITHQHDINGWNAGGPDHYLVASGDRLLMVKQTTALHTPVWFDVFEEANLSSGRGQWRGVDTLMGRALFLSEGCSESLPAGDRYAGAREDCIYFLKEREYCYPRTSALYSGVFDMRQKKVSPLPLERLVPQDGPVDRDLVFSR